MFSYIIGCLIGLAMFVCLRYCLDTPSPCGDGPDFDSLPGYSARPDVIIPPKAASDSYSSHSFQKKLYTVFQTYSDYDRLRREYNKYIGINGGQDTSRFMFYSLALPCVGVFSFFAFPWDVPAVKWIVSIALPFAFYFAAKRIYRASSFTFKYKSVNTNTLRKDYDGCIARDCPITYEELKGLQFEPNSSKVPFDPFIYHVLIERIIFMESVLDSLRFRQEFAKVVECFMILIYLVLYSSLGSK